MNIQDVIKEDTKIVVQFSGGKDSITALHKMLPWKDNVTVHYCDTGDSFPHVVAYVEGFCKSNGFKLEIIKPSIDVHEHIKLYGIPSDVVPVWNSVPLRFVMPQRIHIPIQSAGDCCNNMLWMPLHLAALKANPDVVVRGTKGSDAHISVSEYFQDTNTGLHFFSPVWNMTDEDIYKYLQDHKIRLPFQYNEGINHSLDCMRCSAWGNTQSECQRVEFTRKYYPEVMTELQQRSEGIYIAINHAMEEVANFHRTINGDTGVTEQS